MKSLFCLTLLTAATIGSAEVEYCGVYTNGVKTGYSSSNIHPVKLDGRDVMRSDGHWVNNLKVGGSPLHTVVDSTEWYSLDNQPLKELTVSETNGQKMRIEAVYSAKSVEVSFEYAGRKGQRSIGFPEGPVYGNSEQVIRETLRQPGQTLAMWTFESVNLAFAKVEYKYVGPSQTVDHGKQIAATLIEEKSAGNVIRLYVDSEGKTIRREYPQGLMVCRLTAEEALAKADSTVETPDLLDLNALKADSPIGNPFGLVDLKLRFSGEDLSKLPSDESQTVTRDGDAWLIAIHPVAVPEDSGRTISDVQRGKEEWIRPSRYLSADDPKIRSIAKRIADKQKTATKTIFAIKDYVHHLMKPDMGFSGAQDASDVLRLHRGKCTDYTILTTALLRAAGIPARAAAGLVTFDGTFYYHAWAEAWDGAHWLGIDSTSDYRQMAACYVKFGDGNVDDAFNIKILDAKAVHIHVVDMHSKRTGD